MHKKDFLDKFLYTDLILEQNPKNYNTINKYKDIIITYSNINKYDYTTIYFNNIETFNNEILIKELKKYLNPKQEDKFLIIGLGNDKVTPDSLGPKTLDIIIPTTHLLELGSISNKYSNVSKFTPSVIGITGIDSITIIKTLIKEINPTKIIIIDSLKSSNIDNLVHTIQITNRGINPGSGINNNRGEISKNTIKKKVIAIGIPTVVDIKTIIKDTTNEYINIKDNFIVTPTNIDYLIDKLSNILGNSINKTLHTNIDK